MIATGALKQKVNTDEFLRGLESGFNPLRPFCYRVASVNISYGVIMDSAKFKEWACSLSGCDGGNFNADVWLCGIEWGGGDDKSMMYYKKELVEEMAEGAVDPPYDKFDWKHSIQYPYGRSFAKLYAAIQGKEVQEYLNLIASEEWDGSELFKLNLYPIAFGSTHESLWRKYNIDSLTGFDEKHLFQTWCFLNRFPEFSKLRKNRTPAPPKLIIGTGISYLSEFIMCFGWDQKECGVIQYGDIEPHPDAKTQVKRRYYWIDLDSYTKLVVIPFFSGSYGLNSDYLLQEMGTRIGQLMQA